jgi:UDP-N-acetylglucosamine diphosphorylase/glucosamine-1-phosphate N-acetyltransferase
MKNIILFDDGSWSSLLPLSYTRPIAHLRIGILTIAEKWEKYLDGQASYVTQDYLSEKFPINIEQDNFIINGSVLPTEKMVKLVAQLENNEALLCNEELVAARMDSSQFDKLINDQAINELSGIEVNKNDGLLRIKQPWQLFFYNDQELRRDYKLLTEGRKSQTIGISNRISGNQIFIEKGAKVTHAIINSEKGPVYIGKDSEIMEGCIIRGPFALCNNSTLKMGAKVYGATTIGPHCKVGGEINNSIFIGYSNKAHDGYLGDSIIGEWCNLGADTNTSNLKNNYTEIKLWSYKTERFEPTGQLFCGLIMGDHSKSGINTMFNTGTSVGVAANIFGSGYPRNFIPSFSWGGHSGFTTFKLDKAFKVSEAMMKRRGVEFSEDDEKILQHVYLKTSKYRNWEN